MNGGVAPPTDRDRTASVARAAATFVERLRHRGLSIPPDATLTYLDALNAVGVDDRDAVYWAGRATLIRRPEDADAYDAEFGAVFGGVESPVTEPDRAADERAVEFGVDLPDLFDAAVAGGERTSRPATELRWSAREQLGHRDFASCSADELAEIHRCIDELSCTATTRPTRRLRRSRRRRGPLDLRATAASSLRTGGEMMVTRHRSARSRPRRLVLLCDVSGSMEVYARTLVRFAHATIRTGDDVEVFTLGTRCTRVTRTLDTSDVDDALSAAADEVDDWSGGTRLGATLRSFNDGWGQRGTARGAVVVVLSDGWDRGEPGLLAEQTARLRRLAHRLVWVNPLKASPGYAPTAQGMAAALPHVDEFVEGHSLDSLEALAEVIRR